MEAALKHLNNHEILLCWHATSSYSKMLRCRPIVLRNYWLLLFKLCIHFGCIIQWKRLITVTETYHPFNICWRHRIMKIALVPDYRHRLFPSFRMPSLSADWSRAFPQAARCLLPLFGNRFCIKIKYIKHSKGRHLPVDSTFTKTDISMVSFIGSSA